MNFRRFLPVAAVLPIVGLVGACVGPPSPSVDQTPPAPRAAPVPPPVTVPTLSADWRDWPLTPGDWIYRKDARGSLALFGPLGMNAHFVVRCDTAKARIYLSRAGNFAVGASGRMTVRASTAMQSYVLVNSNETPPFAAAELLTTDPQLDAMAFSRGRFIVSVNGVPDLVVPAWPELTRVIEDCRT
jgi:hypothetical protein